MDASTSLTASQFGATLLAVGGLQWLKSASWFPLLKKGEATISRIASILIAGGIAIGIHVTFTGSASQGWNFAGSIPSVYALLVGAFHWAAQFIYQETGYNILQALQALQALAKTITPNDKVKVTEAVPVFAKDGSFAPGAGFGK